MNTSKQTLDSMSMLRWMEAHFVEYASLTVKGERLVIESNMLGTHRVTHGSRILYAGLDQIQAIETYNSI